MIKNPDKFGKVVEDSQRKRPHQNMIERCEDVLRREHEAVVRAVKRLRESAFDKTHYCDTWQLTQGYVSACDDILKMLQKRKG